MNLGAIFAILAKAGAILKVGKIIWNLPKLYRFGKRFGAVAGTILREQRLPNGPETQEFLRATADLMRAKIVDFPNLDEDEIAERLESLAAELEAA